MSYKVINIIYYDNLTNEKMWNKIKFKATYKIDFNSEELINNVVKRINNELNVKKIKITINEIEQKDQLTNEDIHKKTMFNEKSKATINGEIQLKNIKYDLVGEISKSTFLKRETIVKILKNIQNNKFKMFKLNPEDFILNVINIIEEEKATTFIGSITYLKSGEYDNDIFTINNFNGTIEENIIEVKKHIYNYLKYDSNIEKQLAKSLECGEIIVYAKLPNKFKIPTPAGYYNPDFAILFEKEKTIYFIAETKGSLKSMELKGKEKAKIDYAKKHFEYLGKLNNENIKYDVITSYDELIDKLI